MPVRKSVTVSSLLRIALLAVFLQVSHSTGYAQKGTTEAVGGSAASVLSQGKALERQIDGWMRSHFTKTPFANFHRTRR